MRTAAAILIGLAAIEMSGVAAEDKPTDPARERIAIARRIYRERLASTLEQRVAPPTNAAGPHEDPLINEAMAEFLHRWSVRWMDAEVDVAPDRAGRVAAAQAHLDRMKSLETGKMVRKEIADHPAVKELEKIGSPDLVDIDLAQLKDVEGLAESVRRYQDIARYFRLEAEARLASEKAGR